MFTGTEVHGKCCTLLTHHKKNYKNIPLNKIVFNYVTGVDNDEKEGLKIPVKKYLYNVIAEKSIGTVFQHFFPLMLLVKNQTVTALQLKVSSNRANNHKKKKCTETH